MSNKDYRTTNIERENLEAHVELCAERYKQLETRLETIEHKVATIAQTIEESSNSVNKVVVGSAASVVAGLLSVVVTILMKF